MNLWSRQPVEPTRQAREIPCSRRQISLLGLRGEFLRKLLKWLANSVQ